jgi:NAD(P)H dehydrogenase (quinone)
MMILVTGATGQVGLRLVEELNDARVAVTAMVRAEAKALDLPPSVDHVVATLDDPPPAEVLREFDRVFLMSPSHEEQAELEMGFVDALVTAGHRPRVVKLTADGFQEPDCTVRFMRSHRQIAMHLERTGLPITYLAPNLYMENLLSATDTIRERGLILVPAGGGRVGFVAVSDVAAVAARALTDGNPPDIQVITGPEALDYSDVAARVSTVFARQVDYADIPAEEARSMMLDDGVLPWQAEGMLELFEWVSCGGCDTVTDTVRATAGEDARTLEHWLNEQRGAFIGRWPGVSAPRF